MADGIANWLKSLELDRYAAAFIENEIGVRDLVLITEVDLVELGLPIGPRRRVLNAISKLGETPAALPAEPDVASATTEAERRQLTVMFVDLVGSTALSARLDPEEYRTVIQSYQELVSDAVSQFDGHVAKYLGDGVLAYFGWPQAHEGDPERAVRAGLAVIEALAATGADNGGKLKARIGIATGTVVVGDIIGEGMSEAGAVSGETPNLAARLQTGAAPDTVVVADATRRLLGNLFECRDLGLLTLKGMAEPVRAWQIAGEQETESRFEAAHSGRLTPIVGREQEIALLAERWQRARDGEGQLVLLCGEAGIGKSRITQALRDHVAAEPHIRLRYQCSPYYTASALQPFIAQMERVAGFAHDDPPATRLDKLTALLGKSSDDPASVVPLFAELLSLPLEGRYPPLTLGPQRRKDETLSALVAQLLRLAAENPVLVIFEDIHWADPTTLEALQHMEAAIADAPVLAVITFRPEFVLPWRGQAHATRLDLNRLTRRQSAAMIERLTEGKALPGEVLDQILAKTDGVPLFVEELTKAVLESGLVTEVDEGYVLSGPLPPLAIPSTLQDSLMARLDRLSTVKEVAQTGAAIGREFSYRLLAAVWGESEAQLSGALDKLVEAELVFRHGSGEHASYIFKHALVQDAAYGSLLKSRRQVLHRDIAAAIERTLPETAETAPELLAHHLGEAGMAREAFEYWRRAGKRSVRRSAEPEAIVQFNKALGELAKLPPSPERDAEELDVLVALTGALIAVKGYAASEMVAANRKALALAERLGDAPAAFAAFYGRWSALYTSGRVGDSHAFGMEILRHIGDGAIGLRSMVANRLTGTSAFAFGLLHEAVERLQTARSLWTEEINEEAGLLFGQDALVSIDVYQALPLWYLGYPEQAAAMMDSAEARARELRQGNSLGYVLFHAGWLDYLLGRYTRLEAHGRDLQETAGRHGMMTWGVLGNLYMALGRLAANPEPARLGKVETLLDAYRDTEMFIGVPLFCASLARFCGSVGAVERGLAVIEDALSKVVDGGEQANVPELLGIQGGLEGLRGNNSAAEARYRQAMALAASQSSLSMELRAAISLARLVAERGDKAEARALLSPIHGRFTEGFDTADLKAARALLDGFD